MASVYAYKGVVVATDRLLKHYGAMGAACVALDNRVLASSLAVLGLEMPVRPELTGIALALEFCPAEKDLAILTDSMDLL
jgi:hypothetical protein